MIPYTRLTAYCVKYSLKEPRQANHVSSTFAWGCGEKNFWEMISIYEKRSKAVNQSMATQDVVLPVTGMYGYSWIAEYAKSGDESRTLIVDVGSGNGQALKRIMEASPAIPASRLVMQDPPHLNDEIEKLRDEKLLDVKKIPHDFSKEQPVSYNQWREIAPSCFSQAHLCISSAEFTTGMMTTVASYCPNLPRQWIPIQGFSFASRSGRIHRRLCRSDRFAYVGT